MPTMKLASSLPELYRTAAVRNVTVAIGVFDGVHRGHQRILSALVDLARHTGADPVVMTFDPHPRAVLVSPEAAPKRLTARAQQLRILRDVGIRSVVVLPFTPELAALSADEFVTRNLLAVPGRLRGVCVGRTWRFGAGGCGDTGYLTRVGRRHGFEAVSVPEVLWYGRPVSSTRIRRALSAGRLRSAQRMLGRPYALFGPVVHGRGLGRAAFDCPTANIACMGMQLPPTGVYAARARIAESEYGEVSVPQDGILYLGAAPTLQDMSSRETAPVAEFHFFHAMRTLYGRYIEVEPVVRLRPDRRFPSVAALRDQIHRDIETASRALCTPP
ncbi:MAG: riboflavin biosynthesis protein RibF [Kiritimatiellaeota bacterium]|nr:riboflavin biosynthesis protein RibF [Kiritimatiellota bacterium]